MKGNKSTDKDALLIAISPTPRGFGYAVFEGPQEPLDWGVKEARINVYARNIRRLNELIDFYEPDLVVTEDISTWPRRGKRAQRFERGLRKVAFRRNLAVKRYSQSAVEDIFEQFGAKKKILRARKIAEWLPSLSARLPRARRPWMSEDYRMAIFDAAALALVCYYLEDH